MFACEPQARESSEIVRFSPAFHSCTDFFFLFAPKYSSIEQTDLLVREPSRLFRA